MHPVAAFFKLIRWPNLVFIAITQWLFYFFVFLSVYHNSPELTLHFHKTSYLFYLLIVASMLIAAAGYMINDYFDMQIDAVNKPDKMVVDRVIKRRWVIVWHLCFSAAGILISLFISLKTGKWVIVLVNAICVVLLWFYSTDFKKKLVIGNVVISLMTAWVIGVVYFYAGATLLNFKGWDPANYPFNVKQFYKLTILYTGFAFVISLIREAVKDMEDVIGDSRYNCKTIPIQWGITAAKVYVAVWMVVSAASLIIIEIYTWQSGRWLSSLYGFFFIIIPLIFSMRLLKKAEVSADYHQLSNSIKFVMFAGILSMIFFRFSF